MNEKKDEISQVMLVDDKDWFLQELVIMANSGNNISFGITLNVGGFLVSGHLIGGKTYFEGFGADFVSNFDDNDAAEKVKATFVQRGNDIYPSNENQSPPAYIHMREARFYNTSGNPIPGNRGVWWRGRLSAVDGFSLGVLIAERS